MKQVKGGVTAAKGFEAASTAAGINAAQQTTIGARFNRNYRAKSNWSTLIDYD